MSFREIKYPILHTVWFDNHHVLILKIYRGKGFFWRKIQFFGDLQIFLSWTH